MRKIQITAVEIQSKAEVVVLNSSFVAKSVRGGDVAAEALRALEQDAPVMAMVDDHGNDVIDETGRPLTETDWEEWRRRGYPGLPVREVFEKLLPFAVELRDALLND